MAKEAEDYGGFEDLVDHILSSFITFVQSYYLTVKKDSSMIVTDQYPDTDDKGEKRPRIVVRRMRLSKQRDTAIARDRMSLDLKTGIEERLSLSDFGISIECLSRDGLKSERMALGIFNQLDLEELQICRELPVHSIDTMSVEDEQMLEIKGVRTEWVNVPIRLAMTLSVYRKVINDSGEPLKEIIPKLTYK